MTTGGHELGQRSFDDFHGAMSGIYFAGTPPIWMDAGLEKL
jgi:hypothetical protein